MAAGVRRADAVLVLLLVVACAPTAIDEADARLIAIESAERQAAPGMSIEGIEVSVARQVSRGTIPGWTLEIEGKALMLGEADGTIRAWRLFIDDATGDVTIEGHA